jgi:hypothetical protein
LKIIVLGKSFAGKSMALKRYGDGNYVELSLLNVDFFLSLENGVTILNIEQLLHDAIEAFNNNEMLDGEVS